MPNLPVPCSGWVDGCGWVVWVWVGGDGGPGGVGGVGVGGLVGGGGWVWVGVRAAENASELQ